METETKTFGSIPYDILIEIFQYLSIEDLVSSAQYVCKSWHDIIQDTILWKDVSFKPPLGMKSEKVMLLLKDTPMLKSFEFREGLKIEEIIDTLCQYNKCITSLSFDSFQVHQSVMKKLLTNFPDLEHLQIPFSEFMNNLHTLALFPKLKRVKCSHIFQSNVLLRRADNVPFTEDSWPTLESLEVLSEHVDKKFEYFFEFVGNRLLELHMQAVRSPSALLSIKNCVRLERLKLNLLSRQLFDVELEEVFTNFKQLSNLKYLSLVSFVHPDANILCKIFDNTMFAKLQELDLSHCKNFNYQAARSVVNACPQLQVVCLHGCIVLDDLCLNELSRCSYLKVLNIAGCRFVTETGLSHLKSCIRLRELNLNWVGVVSLPMLEEIAKIKSLCILHLDHTELNLNHLLNAVMSMPNMKQLSVYHTSGVDGAHLQDRLSLCQVKCVKHSLRNAIQEKASCLKRLELNGVPNDVLDPVRDCKNLEELTMNFLMRPCFNFPDFIPILQKFETLHILTLKCFVATEEILLCQLFSEGLSALRELNLECCLSVNQNLAEVISKFHPKLEKLRMKGCVTLNDQGLLAIMEIKSLNVLDVSGCQGLTQTGLMYLQKCEGLKELNICGMACGVVSESVLFPILSIKELNILYADSTDDIKTFIKKNNWSCSNTMNCGREAKYIPCML